MILPPRAHLYALHEPAIAGRISLREIFHSHRARAAVPHLRVCECGNADSILEFPPAETVVGDVFKISIAQANKWIGVKVSLCTVRDEQRIFDRRALS